MPTSSWPRLFLAAIGLVFSIPGSTNHAPALHTISPPLPSSSRAEFDSRWPTRHRYLFPILFFGFLFSPCVRACVCVCSLCTHRVAGIWGRSSNRRMIDASLGGGRRENWSWPDLQVLRLFDRGFNFGRVRFLDFAIRFFNRLRNSLASKFESWKLVERDDESTGSDYFKFSKYDDFLNFGRKYESIWRGWKFIRGFKFSSVAIRWRWHSIASKFWNRGGMEIKIKYPSQQYHVQSDISKNIYIFSQEQVYKILLIPILSLSHPTSIIQISTSSKIQITSKSLLIQRKRKRNLFIA